MKANELMIGDLVQGFLPDTYSQVYGVINECRVAIVGGGAYMEVSNEDIQPIPLTAEILEKNGYVEQEYGWRKLNAANWCININIFNGKERYALSVLGINAQVTLHGYYVHELQHALRLCGIDKVIVL